MPTSSKRGDNIKLDGVWSINDQPVNITDYTLACQMRNDDDTSVINMTVVVTDGPSGSFRLTAEPNITQGMLITTYKYDVQFTSPSGFVSSGETLEHTIEKDITVL